MAKKINIYLYIYFIIKSTIVPAAHLLSILRTNHIQNKLIEKIQLDMSIPAFCIIAFLDVHINNDDYYSVQTNAQYV